MNLSLIPNQILAESVSTESKLFFIIYPELMNFLGSMDAAAFVQRLHFWLQNPNAGYLLKDGRKRILNGYKEWKTQFSIFSVKKIGAIVRLLEKIGWIRTERFYSLKQDIGFVGAPPPLQEDNQRKWYYLDYQKILADTGFDLLFTQESDNSTVEPKRRKHATKANTPNQDIAISQIKTLQYPDLGQSSIHRESNKTKHSQEESETKNLEVEQEQEQETVENVQTSQEFQQRNSQGATILDVDKSSAARASSEKIAKTESLLRDSGFNDRPLRQSPKRKYPEGPWLTENGYLNEDFLLAQVQMWRTGDDVRSKAFGAMAIEDVEAIIACHYQKLENHAKLETHWGAYVKKAKHYLGNVRHRIEADINIPVDEQRKILAKAPAVNAQEIEPIYELALSPWNQTDILQLSQNAAAPGGSQEIAPGGSQEIAPGVSQPIAPPVDEKFGCQNVAAYSNTVKEDDRNFWANISIQGKVSKSGESKSFSKISSVIDKVQIDGR